jgi:hypothetical protein
MKIGRHQSLQNMRTKEQLNCSKDINSWDLVVETTLDQESHDSLLEGLYDGYGT